MSFNARNQLKMLIKLAGADESIAENEQNMIYHIAQAYQLERSDVDEMIKNKEEFELGSLETLSNDQKFEYLYNVVQLMKVDRQVFLSEIRFCQRIAERLGFKKSVVAEFSSKIYGDPSITTDKEGLKEDMLKFLK